MKYLSIMEYNIMVSELKEIVQKSLEPSTSYHKAFAEGYNGAVQNIPYLTIYTQYLTKNDKADLKDLHSLCLGYGTGQSVVEQIMDELDDDKTFH